MKKHLKFFATQKKNNDQCMRITSSKFQNFFLQKEVFVLKLMIPKQRNICHIFCFGRSFGLFLIITEQILKSIE